MGNEYSSPRRDDDGDTIMSGVSGWSYDRDKMKRSVNKNKRDGTYGPANFIDAICGGMIFDEDEDDSPNKSKRSSSRRSKKSDEDEYSDDDTYNSERPKDRKAKLKSSRSIESEDYSYDDTSKRESPNNRGSESVEKQDSLDTVSPKAADNVVSFDSHATPTGNSTMLAKPLASAFAKRCYFTKAGIGPLSQHYEGVTLTGNTVLMLASAMKLKGCPTICDEDLRRVEQTFPNQFSRLPDELLLSSGWRRISKYCHFSGKPVPDGVPFFHSKERLHPQSGGYYFLVASSLGMERPSEVEPLTMDMLILMQTDFPVLCDQAPKQLLEEPDEWTLVTKFCFFSGGPINAEEDVYYEADFDGNPIHMLAFLSPNLTPEELYRLNDITGENALKSVAAVEEVDKVYNLTERDFEDLKLYHLGPCRALPSYLLSPDAWRKVLPNSFIECREKALARAYEFESHAQEAIAAAGKLIGNGASMNQQHQLAPQDDNDNGYIEFNKAPEPDYSNSREEININDEHIPVMDEEILQEHDQQDEEFRSGYTKTTLQAARKSLSPLRKREASRSISPTRRVPVQEEEEEEEEFPDPDPSLGIGELSNEFPNIDDDDDDDIDIEPVVPPTVKRTNIDNFEHDRLQMEEDRPMDEAMGYGNVEKRVSNHIDRDHMSKSQYESIGVIGSKTDDDGDDQIEQSRYRSPSASPQREERSLSPKRHLPQRHDLEVDTHVDEVIDVPDPSPKDIISPISVTSPAPSTPTFAPTPTTVGSAKSHNSYTKSSAMRGAQELLKKNRQQRLAIMAKRRGNSSNTLDTSLIGNGTPNNENNAPNLKAKTVYSRSRNRSVTPARRGVKSPVVQKKALSPNNAPAVAVAVEPVDQPKRQVKMSMYRSTSSGRANFVAEKSNPTLPNFQNGIDDDVRSDATSAISGTSSVWTDATDSKDSRRALILKMAKNRMKKKKGDNSVASNNSVNN